MGLNFEKFAQEGNAFINELSSSLGHPYETERTGIILRAVMHTLRDRLPIAESLNLLSQLPMFLKAIYVEQWKYHSKPERIDTIAEFKEAVKKTQASFGERDFDWQMSTEDIIKIVINTMTKYVSEGELNHIVSNLPKELQAMVRSAGGTA